jgi:DNA-binding IclR family transcriptional regulator
MLANRQPANPSSMPRKPTTARPPATEGGVAAIDRSVAILVALETARDPLTLAELAAATRLYKSTLLRILTSLRNANLVQRRADQRYALGHFALSLGRAFEATHHVEASVLPVIEWLIAQGSESGSFHVRHDTRSRLCLFRVDSGHATLDRVRAGDLLPMARGAPGKVLTTFAKGVASAEGVSPICTSFGERDPSCAAVSVPVFGPDGDLVGALSLSGPLERFSEAAVKKMSKMLLVAAQTATRSLGGTWPDKVAS